MRLNIDNLRKLIDTYAEGSYTRFGKMSHIDVALLYRILNGKGGAGVKTLNTLIQFCIEHGLDYRDYIFLP